MGISFRKDLMISVKLTALSTLIYFVSGGIVSSIINISITLSFSDLYYFVFVLGLGIGCFIFSLRFFAINKAFKIGIKSLIAAAISLLIGNFIAYEFTEFLINDFLWVILSEDYTLILRTLLNIAFISIIYNVFIVKIAFNANFSKVLFLNSLIVILFALLIFGLPLIYFLTKPDETLFIQFISFVMLDAITSAIVGSSYGYFLSAERQSISG